MVGYVSKQVYIPERKTLLGIERSFADLLQDLEQQEGAARSSLLKLFVSVVASIREDKSFKRLELKGAKHIVSSISEEEFCKHTIWGRTSIDEYLDKELEKALGSCRLGLDMFISRIPNGTPIDSFGSLTLAPSNFSECQEQDLTEKFDTRDFVFPSSLFLLGNLDDGQKKAALPVFMLSSSFDLFGRGANDGFLSHDSVNINLILEDCSTGHINIDGEDWLKGSVQIGKKSFLLSELYKKILHSYKFWTGYKEASVDESARGKIFGLLFIPSGNDYRSRTALLCPVQLHFESEDASCFVAKVAELVENISILVKLLGGLLEKYLAHAVEGLVNERLVLANTQSAISAIMSRNGSHNIGSHVLSALSHNVGTMPDDRVLYQYIQHRMDYIATATTGFPDWGVPTMFVGEIMRNFMIQHHLLDHIVESEGLHAYHFQGHNAYAEENQRDALRIRIVSIDGKNEAGCIREYPFISYPGDKGSCADAALHDIRVAIPGGVAGHHAIYTILENVIRNAAKHSWANGKQSKPTNLEITIRFEKADTDCVRITVFDNVGKTGEELKNLVVSINEKLNARLISADEDGGLRQENWGMAEMRISAAYLQRRSLAETGGLEELAEDDFIIKAVPVDNKYLGYEFHVSTPKEMLFVMPACNEDHTEGLTWAELRERLSNNPAILKNLDDCGIHLAVEGEDGDGYYEWVQKGRSVERRHIHNMRYEYVILPRLPNDLNKGVYPFRILVWAGSENGDRVWDKENPFLSQPIGDKMIPSLCDLQHKIKWLLINAEKAVVDGRNDDVRTLIYVLKEYIYLRWLQYVERRTRSSSNKKRSIKVLVDTDGTSSGNAGQGLISDYDVCRYIFEHVWGTILDEVKSSVPGGGQLARMFESEKLSAVGFFDEWLEHWLGHCGSESKEQGLKAKEIESSFRGAVVAMLGKPGMKDLKNDKNEVIADEGRKVLEDALVKQLTGAFPAAHALLRKYAEKIDTLPEGFCEMEMEVGSGSHDDQRQNGQIIQGRYSQEVLGGQCGDVFGNLYLRRKDKRKEYDQGITNSLTITYCRHGDKTERSVYQSGLSGSQSSFSQFQHLEYCPDTDKGTRMSMFAHLVENALMRVLIVDERVCRFLLGRERIVKRLKAMRVQAVDTDMGDIGADSTNGQKNNRLKASQQDGNYFETADGLVRLLWGEFKKCARGDGDFAAAKVLLREKHDVLIIHQGIIDKLLGERCNANRVESFLNRLKKVIPYVVITTGRGRPANTPASARILPFPCVERYLFQEWPEKFLLINSIMNLLPCGKVNDNG